MTQDLIRYDLLVQDALKGVVRKVLGDATRDGLPGDHHFYVSFRTDYPGVRLSTRMREKYPQDMTIVLQHQFWDLAVTEHALEVGLSFSGVPERLLIPFDAMTGFFDPSVQFGLKFELQEPPALAAPALTPVSALHKPEANESEPRAGAKAPALRGAGSEPEVAEPIQAPATRASSKAKSAESKAQQAEDKVKSGKGSDGKGSDGKGSAARDAAPKEPAEKTPQDGAEVASAEVVSLDSFRKKH